MKVNFYATLRAIAGQKTVELELDDGRVTARELLNEVVIRFPAMREELLDESGEKHGHVHLFINGRDVEYLEDVLDTTLAVNDKIDIFPAVGGG